MLFFIKLMNRNIPIQLLHIIINLFLNVFRALNGKVSSQQCSLSQVMQGSVLSPVLFAIDNLITLAVPRCGRFVFIC